MAKLPLRRKQRNTIIGVSPPKIETVAGRCKAAKAKAAITLASKKKAVGMFSLLYLLAKSFQITKAIKLIKNKRISTSSIIPP